MNANELELLFNVDMKKQGRELLIAKVHLRALLVYLRGCDESLTGVEASVVERIVRKGLGE